MKSLFGIAFILLVLAGALVAFAPATLVDSRLAHATDGQVRIAEAAGTLWRGQGLVVDRTGALRVPVSWTVAPWPLARGIVAIDLSASDAHGAVQGHVELNDQRIRIERFELTLPASAITAAMANGAVHAGGALRLYSDAITHAPSGSSGSARGEWRRARLVAFDGVVFDLGTVSASLAVRGTEFAGPLDASGGEVLVNGQIAFSASGARLDLELLPAANATAAVRNALAKFGAVDARGEVRLRTSYPPR